MKKINNLNELEVGDYFIRFYRADDVRIARVVSFEERIYTKVYSKTFYFVDGKITGLKIQISSIDNRGFETYKLTKCSFWESFL